MSKKRNRDKKCFNLKILTWKVAFACTYFVTLWMISRSFQRPARALSSRWVPVGQSNFLARLIREFVWGEWVVEHSSGVSGISFRDMSRIFLNASLLSCVAFRTFLLIVLNKLAPWKGKELNLRVWYRLVFSGWIYMIQCKLRVQFDSQIPYFFISPDIAYL